MNAITNFLSPKTVTTIRSLVGGTVPSNTQMWLHTVVAAERRFKEMCNRVRLCSGFAISMDGSTLENKQQGVVTLLHTWKETFLADISLLGGVDAADSNAYRNIAVKVRDGDCLPGSFLPPTESPSHTGD